MNLTKEQIDKINKLSPNEWQGNEQGVFVEPFGVPNHIKEPVVYMRWVTGGVSGGSCWDDSDPREFYNYGVPDFKCLDLVLTELIPNLSYLQYKKVVEIIESNEDTEWEYYGNRTDFGIKYVVLSKLISLIKTFNE